MTKHEEHLWAKANRWATIFQLLPFVRFVAVTGSLGRGEAKSDSDADLFLVTSPKHLFTARAFVLALAQASGQRHHAEKNITPGTIDPNYWLSSDHLLISPRNAYTARDFTYMMPLWDSSAIYLRLKEMNPWISQYKRRFRDVMPPRQSPVLRAIQYSAELLCLLFGDGLERWVKSVQERNLKNYATRNGITDFIITEREIRVFPPK